MTMKIAADANGWPTRERALFSAEARPARSTDTGFMKGAGPGEPRPRGGRYPQPPRGAEGHEQGSAGEQGPRPDLPGERPGPGREEDQGEPVGDGGGRRA